MPYYKKRQSRPPGQPQQTYSPVNNRARMNFAGDDEEQQGYLGSVGRMSISSGSDVDIIETDESEDDDLSDHDAVVKTDSRGRSRRSRSSSRTHGPDRQSNLSGSSNTNRFRRTSAKPGTSTMSGSSTRAATSTSTDSLWAAGRGVDSVDQSVNLMDMPMDGTDTGSLVRPGMNSGRQKSMVDVFLGDLHGNRSDYGVEDLNDGKKNRVFSFFCNKYFLLALGVLAVILFVVLTPNFGLVANSMEKDNNNNNSAPEKTPAPTEAPHQTHAEELIHQDEVDVPHLHEKEELIHQDEVDVPSPTEDDNDDGVMTLDDVPSTGRMDALRFYLNDLDISDPKQLGIMGSPVKKAMHWIENKDPLRVPIPGMENNQNEIETTNLVAKDVLLQRYALAVFYYSMAESVTSDAGRSRRFLEQKEKANREEFDNSWLSEKPTCEWHGVVCEDEQVTQILLQQTLLQGTIPRELLDGGAMPYLRHLDLSMNALEGTLPEISPERDDVGSQLGFTPSGSVLHVLNLMTNELTGSLDNLMALTNLKHVILDQNKLSGNVPEGISDLSHVEFLGLSKNHLIGTLPDHSIREMTTLKVVDFGSNKLTGPLPKDWYTLTNMQKLFLAGNRFTGSIPADYGDLSGLTVLMLDDNDLIGTIPGHLGKLTLLTDLEVDGNKLTGNMPQHICDLRAGNLKILESDCAAESNLVTCPSDCCTDCY